MEPENLKPKKRELKVGNAVLIEIAGTIRQALVEEVSPNGEYFRAVTKGENDRPLWFRSERVLDVIGSVDIDGLREKMVREKTAAEREPKPKEISKLRVDGRHVF